MNQPFRLGLTGSIGMGKSTTAEMFGAEGVPVWDADAAVHRLYDKDGAGVAAVQALCPACVPDGAVDRTRLKAWIAEDQSHLPRLEAAIHPLVAEDRAAFLETAKADIVLLDIPLLYETGGAADMDAVVVVSVSATIQKARVMSRDGMTEAHFAQILARQMPDAEKRARANFVITTKSLEAAKAQVHDVLKQVRSRIDA